MKTYQSNDPPIIFLAFANEVTKEAGVLRSLANERKGIQAVLKESVKENLCELIIESNVTLDEIFTKFQEKGIGERIAIFHYAGHANVDSLRLESSTKSNHDIKAKGLIQLLSNHAINGNLKLAFLNGCSTFRQVLNLTTEGVPAAIGTTNEIGDELATKLAITFYRSIGQGHSIEKAWADTEAFSLAYNNDGDQEDNRGVSLREKEESNTFEWLFEIKEGAENILNWNLPDVVGKYTFGLPSVSDLYDLPNSPFRNLDRFTEKHAEIFFGRGKEIRQLYETINDDKRPPVILFHGQSGVGKSSLIEAGLKPRLHNEYETIYLRRNNDQDYISQLGEILDVKKGQTLLEAWKEKETEKPLIIILDQVEEIITRPIIGQEEELLALFNTIKTIIERRDTRPKGKLILSYRKDFHPEISDHAKNLDIPFAAIFIKKLDKNGIIDAITGLTQTQNLRNRYHLSIEDNLPIIIADDLEEDKSSAIAPVLQILLTKMWMEAKKINEETPAFTVDLYQSLKREGILLQDFLNDKLEELKQWNLEAVESGFVMDLLNFHTTSKSTANQKSKEEILAKYSHRKEFIEELLQKIESKYLLTDTSDFQPALKKKAYTLAHDTLAPLVREMFNLSDSPGQKAHRVMKNKIEPLSKTEVNVENSRKGLLTEQELSLLEEGKDGMRAWDDKELEIFETCKKEINSLKRRKKILSIALLLSMLTLFGAVGFGYLKEKENNKINSSKRFLAEGQNELSSDPTKAYEYFYKADSIYGDSATQRRLIDIKRDYVFYDVVKETDFTFNKASFSFDGKYCAFSKNSDKSSIHLINLKNKTEKPNLLYKANQAFSSISFSSDGKQLLASSIDRNIYLWQAESLGQPFVFTNEEASSIGYAAFSEDGRFVIGKSENHIYIWRINQAEPFYKTEAYEKEPNAIQFNDGKLMIGNQNGVLTFIDIRNNRIIKDSSQTSGIKCMELSNQLLYVGRENGRLEIWRVGSEELIFKDKYIDKSEAITQIEVDEKSKKVITAFADNTATVWDLENMRALRNLIGHKNAITDISSIKNENVIYSCSDNQIFKWNLPYLRPIEHLELEERMNSLHFINGEKAILLSKGNNIYSINLTSNKMDNIFSLSLDKITTGTLSKDKSNLFIGTENGNVHQLKINGENLSLEGAPFVVSKDFSVEEISIVDPNKILARMKNDDLLLIDLDKAKIDTMVTGATAFQYFDELKEAWIFLEDSTFISIDVNSKEKTFSLEGIDKINSTVAVPESEACFSSSNNAVYKLKKNKGFEPFFIRSGIRSVNVFSKDKPFLTILTSVKNNPGELFIIDQNKNIIQQFQCPKKGRNAKVYPSPDGHHVYELNGSDIYVWRIGL